MSYKPRLLSIVDGGNGVPTGGSNDPSNAFYNYANDFESCNTPTPFTTNTSGTGASVSVNNTAVSGHPGIFTLQTGTVSTNFASLYMVSSGPLILGAGILTCTWYFRINTLSNVTDRYTLYLGLTNTGGGTAPSDGCYVQYADNVNSGNWQFVTAKSSTRTTSNSSTAVATGWQVLQMQINAAASSVSYSVGTTLANLASLGTAITTNIPTNGIGPNFQVVKSAGTSNLLFDADLITLSMPLTTAR